MKAPPWLFDFAFTACRTRPPHYLAVVVVVVVDALHSLLIQQSSGLQVERKDVCSALGVSRSLNSRPLKPDTARPDPLKPAALELIFTPRE